jgi:hypothetical protein
MERVAAHAKERKSLARPKNAKWYESRGKREEAAKAEADWMMKSIEAAKKRTIEAAERREAEKPADQWEIRDGNGTLLATFVGDQPGAEQYAKELAMEQWVTIDGIRFVRHKDVPAFAYGRKYIPFEPGQPVEIHWEWIDPANGKTMGLKQMIFDLESGGRPKWIAGDYNDKAKRRNKAIDSLGGPTLRCKKCDDSLMRYPFKDDLYTDYHPACAPDSKPRRESNIELTVPKAYRGKRTTSPGPSAGRIGSEENYRK